MTDELRRYLDNINLEEFLEKGRSFENIMDEIEAIYGDDFYEQNDYWMFEDCSQEDFAEYVRREYGVKHYERNILFVK